MKNIYTEELRLNNKLNSEIEKLYLVIPNLHEKEYESDREPLQDFVIEQVYCKKLKTKGIFKNIN